MLLISMLSVVYSKFQWNESVQFATLPFRNAGFKVQVCMASGGKRGSGALPHLLHVLLVCSLPESFVSFRSQVVVVVVVVIVVVVVVSWSCRGLVFSGVDDAKTTRSVSLNVSVNSR